MKSLEYCLDFILKELVKNWDGVADQRTAMVCEVVLKQFGLPNNYKKHEFFERLIDKLIKDGYAEFIDLNSISEPLTKIQYYQEKSIITIEGFYFIKNGGYVKQDFNQGLRTFARWLNVIVLCVAALIASWYYGGEIYNILKNKSMSPQKQDTVLLKLQLSLPAQDSTFLIRTVKTKK